jgi:hypothetical protein
MLFKDSNTLKEYAQLTGEINFASVKPTLRFVETIHIIPVIGKELYNDLNTAFNDAATLDDLDEPQVNLLEQCRYIIGPYLCYYYAPKSDVQLNDGGMSKNKDAAFQYQGTNFREANLREAETATELLLQFLEDNSDDYPEWLASSAFEEYRKLFIKTGKEFNENFTSASPYRNFHAMRNKMVDVEEHNIRMAIGDTLFDALKAKDKAEAPTFTDKEKQLLFKLKKAIANFTVAFSVPLLNVRIDANGITVVAYGPSTSRDQDNMRTNASSDAQSILIAKCIDAAESWLSDALKFLNDNATDFPQWSSANADENTSDESSVNGELLGSFGLI